MYIFFGIAYFIVGFAQFFAIQDWFIHYLNFGTFISFIAAMFLTYIPLLGSVLGVIGAHEYWGWSWIAAFLLFFWYVPAYLVLFVLIKLAIIKSK